MHMQGENKADPAPDVLTGNESLLMLAPTAPHPFHLLLVAIIPRGQCAQVSGLGRIKSRMHEGRKVPYPRLRRQWKQLADRRAQRVCPLLL